MAPRWYRRMWGSLHEPRTVTALMVVAYALIAWTALMILADDDPHDVGTKVAAVFMLAGGIVGVPTAWRGAWWLELAGAGLATCGLIFLAVIDMAAGTELLPGYSELRTVLIAILFATRALRIAPELYAPGRGTVTPTREAQIRAEAMVTLADEAAQDARRKRDTTD